MLDLKMLIGGGVAALAIGGFAGWKVGHDRGVVAGAASAKVAYDLLYQTSLRVIAERDQCKGEVEKFNGETERLRTENDAILAADRVASAEAVKRAEQAAINAAREAEKSIVRMREGGDALKKLADTCIVSGVPAGFVDVLNSVTRGADNPGDGQVPDSKAGDRPVIQGKPSGLSK